MKRLIVVAAALALAACGLTPAPVPSPTPAGLIAEAVAKADTVVLTGERAFAVAELAYTTAAEGARLAIRSGGITGSNAAWVRDRNIEVRAWLVAGTKTADAAEKARLAAQIFGVTARLNTLTGSK